MCINVVGIPIVFGVHCTYRKHGPQFPLLALVFRSYSLQKSCALQPFLPWPQPLTRSLIKRAVVVGEEGLGLPIEGGVSRTQSQSCGPHKCLSGNSFFSCLPQTSMAVAFRFLEFLIPVDYFTFPGVSCKTGSWAGKAPPQEGCLSGSWWISGPSFSFKRMSSNDAGHIPHPSSPLLTRTIKWSLSCLYCEDTSGPWK